MQSSKGVFFYEKCRLCLERPGVHHIFEDKELQNDVFQCTGVQVNVSDNLPQKICLNCSDVIANAKELRLLANKNDVLLKSLFANDDDECEDESVKEATNRSQESQTLERKSAPELETHKKKHKAKPENNNKSISNKQNEPTSSDTGKIRVRRDLMVSSSNKPILCVTTKSEYDELKKKIKLEKDLKEISFKCELCSKTFETWKKLYLHTRGHNKSIACPLDVCGKKFATNGDLMKHLRTHTGERPFLCEVCDKCFTQQGTLKAHIENVHAGVYIIP